MHGGGGKKDKNGKIVMNKKDRGKLWKEQMEKILNVENELGQMAEADMVEGGDEGYEQDEIGKSSWTFKSKYGHDNIEWKVGCYNKEALSENTGW